MRRDELLDHYWLELLVAMVGEQFDDHGDHVCGAVVNVRAKGDKVFIHKILTLLDILFYFPDV